MKLLLRLKSVRWAAACLVLAALSGCYTAGTQFESNGLAWLQPGITPLSDAKVYLKAEPDQTYYRHDGSSLQIWRYNRSLFPDGVYLDREIWLEFDQLGILQRVVKQKNIQNKADKANDF
ncbi:MAG TPA: hypothetical protein H9906_04180 [Candidatus Paenalcaligenes intestinipullorum]|uniref:Lipoprotein n=1 Tax=Candidatus Paenalcaligenes intestinipullorum TaxID=2838718 RepID=A0A9D2RKR8_9BURK|nr:hypothetical protein [Candidatus Paenalcaligenes intestinipullorum]